MKKQYTVWVDNAEYYLALIPGNTKQILKKIAECIPVDKKITDVEIFVVHFPEQGRCLIKNKGYESFNAMG